MKTQQLRQFTEGDHRTWQKLFDRQTPLRNVQMHPIFARGLEKLGIAERGVPDLDDVNRRLKKITGFEGVPVEGLEQGQSFFVGLQERKFPLGNFIRDERDLNYTPAPDIFHDLYGHIPFFADKDYAEFCRKAGDAAASLEGDADKQRQFERFFWFTIEFGLVETPKGRRIFGAGIASSFSECAYALSTEPDVVPYTVEAVRSQEYRIDMMQKRLFVMQSPEELYNSLDQVIEKIKTTPVREVSPVQM
ncbi:MAG: phenylalanine 4-monooxygenase [Deltaproteobacteria bacterium]|nr:phenylalanine 4-monooxygenase [Deltaproteobacteria bacterium]MBI3294671.1 phenylalanine 4-monooxygenase [Deltaproteobacteria bacterium]